LLDQQSGRRSTCTWRWVVTDEGTIAERR
jgi:hypothetical protein